MAIEKNQRIKAEDVRQGLTIWDPSLEYQINATCYYVNDGEGIPYTIYRNITGNNTSTNPSEDTTNWEALKLGGSGGANLPMFYSHRFSWKPQDVSWVNSENYSWLYKTPYIGAYDHLVKRYQPTGKFREGNTYYVIIFSDGDIQTTNVTVASGTVSNLQTWATEKGYTTTGSSIEDLIVSKTLTAETETIAGTTITFYRCYDKKKIVLPTEVTNVNAIYAATGIAEYFILDIENLRFKLPRNKWGYYGTGSGDLGDYISESLPNITGTFRGGNDISGTNASGAFYDQGSRGDSKSYGAKAGREFYEINFGFDASHSSASYQDNAPVQPRGSKGDLYFYLGSADLDEIVSISFDILNSKANIELNNLTAKGKNIANWSSNVTNCITEIPQDIKLELNNGTLTLKAGSKVYVPRANNEFLEVTISKDLSYTYSAASAKTKLFYNLTKNSIFGETNTGSGSGINPPQAYYTYYDVNSNVVRRSIDGSTWSDDELSLPLCDKTSTQGTGITSIDQVFNGFGYIGSTLFALPGVKGLVPNGRNEDGSLKSVEVTVNSVKISTFTGTAAFTSLLLDSDGRIREGNAVTYNEDKNINNYGYDETFTNFLICGHCKIESGKISNFTLKTPFHAVDYNELTADSSSKADTDLSNITSQGKTNIVNLLAVSSNRVAINFPYTVQKAGMITCEVYTQNNAATVITVNGVTRFHGNIAGVRDGVFSIYVFPGDVVTGQGVNGRWYSPLKIYE